MRNQYNYKSRTGSIIIPAVFLLMFFILMGGALVRNSELAIRLSSNVNESRQAYLLARSGVDLLADSLCMVPQTEKFTQLDDVVKTVGVGGSMAGTISLANPNDISYEIKCTGSVPIPNGQKDTYLIKATSTYRQYTRSVSRYVEAERINAGITDSILGIDIGSGTFHGNYYISAQGNRENNVINGDMRLQNASNVNFERITVDGDLRIEIYSQLGDHNRSVTLENVHVKGDLYIDHMNQASTSAGQIGIKLNDLDVDGDVIILNKKGDSSPAFHQMTIASCSAQNFYLSLDNFWPGKQNTANNVYIAEPLKKANIGSSFLSANIIDGSAGTNTVNSKKSAEETVEILLSTPSEDVCDFVVNDSDTFNELKNAMPLDTGTNGVINILYDGFASTISDMMEFSVIGTGTVNVYLTNSTEIEYPFNLSTTIERLEGSYAAFNFIAADDTVSLISVDYSKGSEKVLDANIISTNAIVTTKNLSINGIIVAPQFDFDGKPSGNFPIINSKPLWLPEGVSITGSAGIGSKSSVKYTYGVYVN